MSDTATSAAKQPGYDYKHLIKPGSTNEQKISALMNHSRAGGLIQAFVMEGLRIYSQEVVDNKDALREQLGPRSFINPEAWIACAEDTLSALGVSIPEKQTEHDA